MVGEWPNPFGEALGFDPITSTLIVGENDAVLVDAMTTVAEAEALAGWRTRAGAPTNGPSFVQGCMVVKPQCKPKKGGCVGFFGADSKATHCEPRR